MATAEATEPVVTAGSPAPRRKTYGQRLRVGLPTWLSVVYALAVLLFLFGPVVLLAAFSFNDSTIIALPFKGFTTDWYTQAFNDPDARDAVWHSLLIAAVVTPVCLVLGTLAAFGLTRLRFRGRGAVGGLMGAPLVVPWLVIGVGALLMFGQFDIPLSLQTIGVMHVVCTFPLVVAIVSAGLVRFDRRLEEAAVDLGCSQLQMLRHIVLPQLAPALAASAIFAFTWSFNNFEISFFTGGYDQTFPVWVFSVLRHSKNLPIVNAMSTVISAAQVLLVFGAWWGLKRLTRKNDQDAVDIVMGGIR
jgi:ABC-type spermidine/putrescine transport system permease subunit II